MKKIVSRSFFLIFGIITLISFLFFYPKVSAKIFSFKRDLILKSFLASTISQGYIDPQKYWELREFYSPGYFNFAHDGFNQKTTDQITKVIAIPIKRDLSSIAFLKFNSKNFISLDSLISNDLIIDFQTNKTGQLIFKNKHSIIYKQGDTIKIAFIFPETEMNRANGFYDFNGADKIFLQDKQWFNISSITPQ